MHCDVYKFPKNPDWYVYIARPDYPDDTSELKDWLGYCRVLCGLSWGWGRSSCTLI